MSKKPKEKLKCPVCDETVDKDPHEACLAQLQAEEQPETGVPEMACPACGKPLGPAHDCVESQG